MSVRTGARVLFIVATVSSLHSFIYFGSRAGLIPIVVRALMAPTPTDYIYDLDPVTNRFISVPKEMGQLNCAAFIGGIIRGVLDSANFVRNPRVTCGVCD